MITHKSYMPNPGRWISDQAYIRGYLDMALKPVSAVMTFLKEESLVVRKSGADQGLPGKGMTRLFQNQVFDYYNV